MSNKTSDKNVATEEDIKYVKEMLEIARVFFKAVKAETNYKDVDDVAFCNAVEHILAEREQKDKRIQELEIKLKCAKGLYDDCCKCLVDSIPKQVVIDAINKHKFAYEELSKMYNNTHYEDDEIRARDFYVIVTEDRIVQVLTKLLGGEK